MVLTKIVPRIQSIFTGILIHDSVCTTFYMWRRPTDVRSVIFRQLNIPYNNRFQKNAHHIPLNTKKSETCPISSTAKYFPILRYYTSFLIKLSWGLCSYKLIICNPSANLVMTVSYPSMMWKNFAPQSS